MAKTCSCGSPMCPICNPKGKSETANVRRNKNVTQNVRNETPSVRPETEVIQVPVVVKLEEKTWTVDSGYCPTCSRPYCPECGNPIPVRGDYCKPACRSRAWRKKKAE